MSSKYRPIFHMVPHSFWMNDPNGPIYKDGIYHLFYQHNPKAPVWGNIHWGHAVSKDLVRWKQRPLALAPSTENGELHCFSGSCVIRDDGTPLIMYTSVGDGERNPQTGSQQWAAVGSQDLNTWEKVENNPVIDSSIHGDLQILEWRDPYMFSHGDSKYIVIGGSWEGKGCALLYRALDRELMQWEFIDFLSVDSAGHDIWECPNFFQLEGRYVFIYSPISSMQYEIGDFDGRTFSPDTHGVVDYGGWQGLYAANTCSMADGRVVMFCWMPEVLRSAMEEGGEFDWAGVQAIPRILQISEDNELLMYPVESVASLRKFDEVVHVKDRQIEEEYTLPIRGKALDLYWKISMPFNFSDEKAAEDADEACLEISVFVNPEEKEKTSILLFPAKGIVKLDKTKSSIKPHQFANELYADWTMQETGIIEIRLLIDHSTLELFIDNRVCLSTRVYPYYEESELVKLYAGKKAGKAGKDGGDGKNGAEKACSIVEFSGYPMSAHDLFKES